MALVACGARQPTSTIAMRYACDGGTITRDGAYAIRNTDRANLAFTDAAGDHFVFEGSELVVPSDPFKDATLHTRGASKEVCLAEGGYSDVLVRYMRGDSVDKVAVDLQLHSSDQVRDRIHSALMTLSRRYMRDR